MAKSKNDIQLTSVSDKETGVKAKPKKTKKVETLDEVKVVEDSVPVDIEIDCRSYNHSDVVNGYIRRKRSI